MITTINTDNSKWRLIYNENILLLEKSNKLSFDISDEKINFQITINFIFINDGEKYTTVSTLSEDGKSLDIILRKWETENSMQHIENVEPLKLDIVNGNKVWFKYRTQTNEKSNWRNFQLTAWTEEI